MRSFSYEITDEAGIHARPAGMLVKAMQGYDADVTIACGAKTASAKKLFALMGLAVRCGETITVSADGPDEEAALAAAQEFLSVNL